MNKNDFFYLSEGMENCKMSGKNQGKGNFEVDSDEAPHNELPHLD